MVHSDVPLPGELREALYRALRAWHKPTPPKTLLQELALYQRHSRAGENEQLTTNRVLLAALEQLRVHHPHGAALLEERFLDQILTEDIAHRLNISPRTYFTMQNRALDALAEVLWGMEQAARAESAARLELQLPVPSYLRLVGLDVLLVQPMEALTRAEPPWIVALEGIGGIGKTTLAHMLVRQVMAQRRFENVAWVSAQQYVFDLGGGLTATNAPALSPECLLESLAEQLLGDDLFPPGSYHSEAAQAALWQRLKARPHLVVVDNLETAPDVDALLPVLRRLVHPSKILLTSRVARYADADIYHFTVPELAEPAALELVRYEARARHLPALVGADDATLHPIYQTVGGNPLALRLVVGQSHVYGLEALLDDLVKARGTPISNLYTYIYRRAWDALDESARRALLAMPLTPVAGGTFDFLVSASGLSPAQLRDALERLVTRNLVDQSRGLLAKSYSIHGLTRTFLHEQVARWS